METENQRVRVTIDKHGVAEVTMIRGDKMNAIDIHMFRGFIDAIDQLRSDDQVRVVVVHGEGRSFCAGLDIGLFEQMTSGRITDALGDILDRKHGPANGPQQIAWGWRELAVPVIAAVHGMAFGGGLQIALGADIRCVHPDAQLAVMEIKWGLVPDMAGCVLLSELVRPDIARELTFTGRVISGTQAHAIGLVTRLSNDPLEEARTLAARIAGRSPDAIQAGKRLLNGASPVDAGTVLRLETHEQFQLIGSANQREAVRAGLEKREPRFDHAATRITPLDTSLPDH